MSRKKKSNQELAAERGHHRPPKPNPDDVDETRDSADGAGPSRAVEAMTVAWMLSFMASILGEAGTLISALILMAVGRGKDTPGLLAMVPGVLWFVSIVTGCFCLFLTFLVCRLRPVPPPVNLVRAAVVVGALPWLAILLTWAAQAAK